MSDKYSIRLEKYRAEKMDREKRRAEKKAKQDRNIQLIKQWRHEQQQRKQDEANEQFKQENPHLFILHTPEKTRVSKCYACGDPAKAEFETKPVCPDCYDELKHGVIKNVNIHLFGGRSAVFHWDEENPGFENAIKALEDGFNE
jgi:formylmethanofuran dehydrogenase subunit E